MTPNRGVSENADLLERLDKTLSGLQRRHEQLEAALESFGGEDALAAFDKAFGSSDPVERNRAELVHTGFERYHQLTHDVVDLGGKLAERLELIPKPERKQDRIDIFEQHTIISNADAHMLREQHIVRNESQHAYVDAVSHQVYRAAERQLEKGPAVVAKLARWVDSLRARVSS